MWLHELNRHTTKYFSQAGEDGVLEFIFQNIGTTNKVCVEFGAGDGFGLSNTRHFVNNGWNALMMDYNGGNNIVKSEFVTAENINELFAKYEIPEKFDLLSIDIDGMDYWVWKALKHTPRVVIVEFNGCIPNYKSITVPYNPNHIYDCTDYYGASFQAFKNLGESKGYKLVHQQNKTNLIFVLASELPNVSIEVPFTHDQYHPHDPYNRPWQEV